MLDDLDPDLGEEFSRRHDGLESDMSKARDGISKVG